MRAKRLGFAEWRVLWQVIFLLPGVSLALRWFGFNAVKAKLTRFCPPAPQNPPPAEIARIVNGMARYVGGNCLARSLVLWWLLKRRGIDSQIRLGVRKENAILLAHAWIELDQVVLNDRPDVDTFYEPLTRFTDNLKVS